MKFNAQQTFALVVFGFFMLSTISMVSLAGRESGEGDTDPNVSDENDRWTGEENDESSNNDGTSERDRKTDDGQYYERPDNNDRDPNTNRERPEGDKNYPRDSDMDPSGREGQRLPGEEDGRMPYQQVERQPDGTIIINNYYVQGDLIIQNGVPQYREKPDGEERDRDQKERPGEERPDREQKERPDREQPEEKNIFKEIEMKMKEHRQAMGELEKKVMGLEKKLDSDELTDRERAQIREMMGQLFGKLERHEEAMGELEEQRKELRARMLERELEQHYREIERLERELEEIYGDDEEKPRDELHAELREIQMEMELCREAMGTMERELQQLHKEMENAETDREKMVLREEITAIKGELEEHQHWHKELEMRAKEIRQWMGGEDPDPEPRDELEALKREMKHCRETIGNLERELGHLEEMLAGTRDPEEREAIQGKIRHLNAEITELRQRMEQLQIRWDRLTADPDDNPDDGEEPPEKDIASLIREKEELLKINKEQLDRIKEEHAALMESYKDEDLSEEERAKIYEQLKELYGGLNTHQRTIRELEIELEELYLLL
jgi:chromosome segregation ATPase